MNRSVCLLVAVLILAGAAFPVAPACAGETRTDVWIRNLRSDAKRYNGHGTYVRILDLLKDGGPKALPPTLVPRLEESLTSNDYQLSQFATMILIDVYTREKKPVSQWPETLIDNMVIGLRDDSAKGMIPNALTLMTAIYERNSPRLTARLEKEVVEGDPQSKFCAAMALVHQGTEAVRPHVTAALALSLRDDDAPLNELAAYHAILGLGKENLRQYLAKAKVIDWQEAALLQCLAGDLGVDWTAPESAADQWRRRASWSKRSGLYAVAALYLYPKRDEFLMGKEAPAALERIQGVDGGMTGMAEKARFAKGWFGFMRGANLDELEDGLPNLLKNIIRLWPAKAASEPGGTE